MNEDKVNSLVKFLSNPNRKAEEHVDTVMEMVRELSKYKHTLAEQKAENGKLRDTMAMASREPWMQEYPGSFREDRNQPNILQLPPNTRSVEIKL